MDRKTTIRVAEIQVTNAENNRGMSAIDLVIVGLYFVAAEGETASEKREDSFSQTIHAGCS